MSSLKQQSQFAVATATATSTDDKMMLLSKAFISHDDVLDQWETVLDMPTVLVVARS